MLHQRMSNHGNVALACIRGIDRCLHTIPGYDRISSTYVAPRFLARLFLSRGSTLLQLLYNNELSAYYCLYYYSYGYFYYPRHPPMCIVLLVA